jgi:hypothetical protein
MHLKIVAIVLALLLASGNVLLPSRGTSAQGIDLAGMDKSIDTGDDFFGYANGAWSKAAQIPADRPATEPSMPSPKRSTRAPPA